MEDILEKQAIETDKAHHVPIWEQDMNSETQAAIDKILDVMITRNISPDLTVQGDLISAMSSIIRDLQRLLPQDLEQETKLLSEYLISWVCDYAEEVGLKALNVRFSFKKQEAKSV